MSSAPRTARPAVTLVETLLCVAIVAVLAALLLGPLWQARETARSVRCLANLRSIGQAFEEYRASDIRFYPRSWADLGYAAAAAPAVPLIPGAVRCPADRSDAAVEPWSYYLTAVDQYPGVGSRPLRLSALMDSRPISKWMVASDRRTFRHGLRAGERMNPSQWSSQWLRSWRNKLYGDGSARPLTGPHSITTAQLP